MTFVTKPLAVPWDPGAVDALTVSPNIWATARYGSRIINARATSPRFSSQLASTGLLREADSRAIASNAWISSGALNRFAGSGSRHRSTSEANAAGAFVTTLDSAGALVVVFCTINFWIVVPSYGGLPATIS